MTACMSACAGASVRLFKAAIPNPRDGRCRSLKVDFGFLTVLVLQSGGSLHPLARIPREPRRSRAGQWARCLSRPVQRSPLFLASFQMLEIPSARHRVGSTIMPDGPITS